MSQLTITYGERQKPRLVLVRKLIVGHAFRGTFRDVLGLWVKSPSPGQLLLVSPDASGVAGRTSWSMYINGNEEYLHIDQEFASIEVTVNP